METRTTILSVSLALFADHGYDAVGVQTIVDAAEITKPTLYHYFGSKRGLFETLVREKGNPLLERVREAAVYQHDLNRTLTRVVHAYFDYAHEHQTFYRMLLSMSFAPPSSEYFPAVHDLLYPQYALLESLFEQAANDHGNMRGRHKQYAISFKGMVDTYISMSFQSYVDLKAGNLVYRVTHQFMHGIFS